MTLLNYFNTSSFRLSALYLGLFLCSFLAIGITVYVLTTHTLEKQLKINIDSDINRLKDEYASGGRREIINEINELIGFKSVSTKKYGLLDKNRGVLAGNFSHFDCTEGWQQYAVAPIGPYQSSTQVLTHVIGLPDNTWLAVSDDSSDINEFGTAIIEAFLWGFLLVIALGTAGGAYISHTFFKKITAITQSTQAIIGGDLNHRLLVSKNQDELDNLAALLNRMLDKIAMLIENIQQVSNDIAHDLRTPVSRLKFRLEDALSTNLSKQQHKIKIAEAIIEVDNILATFSALLRISQIESQSRRSGFKRINMSEIVVAVTDALAPVGEEQGKNLQVTVQTLCELQGDKELLTQLVFNLLENALLHTPEQTKITISLAICGTMLKLIIADHGVGIEKTQREKVFQRFYRLEQSRTTPGNGLGLSIVAAIVELHQGQIALLDNQPGLKVVVTLHDNL